MILHSSLFSGGQLKETDVTLEQNVEPRPFPLFSSVKILRHVDLLDVIEQVLLDVCLKVALVTFENGLYMHILFVLLQQLAPGSSRLGEIFRTIRTGQVFDYPASGLETTEKVLSILGVFGIEMFLGVLFVCPGVTETTFCKEIFV